MVAESLETTLKKVKNSGYFFVLVLVANAAMMWQSNKDFTSSQHAINSKQQVLFEQQAATISELKSAVTELRAIVAGQNRRLELLEDRAK